MSTDAIAPRRTLFDRVSPTPKSGSLDMLRAFYQGVQTLGSSASKFAGVDSQYTTILDKQIEVQVQMQLVSLYSNIEKSKHETEMAAIRNTRVG